MRTLDPHLRLVFWETTAGCNLRCIHCRRIDVMETLSKDDLTTAEGHVLVDQIAEVGRPILVFSGGEPLMRSDIFELAGHAKDRGLRIALATNGTKIDADLAWRIRETGFDRVSISLDGAKPGTHDSFRGIPGSHAKAAAALTALRALGVSTQVNFTVARHNVAEVPAIYDLALDLGVDALHFFMLVPVGCGVAIADREMLSSEEYERWLEWVYDREMEGRLEIKATCAPHYTRIVRTGGRRPPASHHRQQATGGHPQSLSHVSRGCLAGSGVCFVSHTGEIFPCGYLPVAAGSVRKQTFQEVWNASPVFERLRRPDLLGGKCGACNFKMVCGGCRARAYSATHDELAQEPFCVYQPPRLNAEGASSSASEGAVGVTA